MAVQLGFDSDDAKEVTRLLEAGDFAAARSLLEERRPQDLDQEFEHALLAGKTAAILGQHDEALEPLLRALRITRKLHRSRVAIRVALGHVLIGTGDLSRAERQLQRGLTELRTKRHDLVQEPRILSYMSIIHRRRGMLSFAIRTLEEAVALIQKMGSRWGSISANLANILMLHDEIDRVGRLLDDLHRHPEQFTPSQYLYLHVLTAVHALEVHDLDRAERSLGNVLDQVDRLELAPRITCQMAMASVARRRGRASEALAQLEATARQVEEAPALRLFAAGIEREISETLCVLGRHEEALDHAQRAVRHGRGSDRFDWAEALLAAAECQHGLGRLEAARISLMEASAVLQSTECHLGRRNLETMARKLGIALESKDSPNDVVDRSAPNVEPTWLTLNGGRSFLSLDPRLVPQLRRYAASDLPVLIEGETGTGKELIAHLLHELGPRSKGPLVIVDCTTLSEGLAEAELFGAARGAYTGAVANREGLVAAAHGGTLFFDELTELSNALQAKLLRLLQEGTYRRLGDPRERKVNTRVVAATNRPVDLLVDKGRLRSDLFYRLRGHRIHLPPLRERPREIRLLADEFARAAGLLGISSGAHRRLATYTWPGNVRELQMLIRAAAADVQPGGWLDEDALAAMGPDILPSPRVTRFRALRVETERRSLTRALAANDGNVSAAARVLGISRQAFYKAMRRVGLSRKGVNHG